MYNIYYRYLYIFQLYEYDLYKFILFVLRSRIFKKYNFKDKLVYTIKIKTYIVFTLILQIITLYLTIVYSKNIIPVILFVILIYFLTPIYIILSSVILEPISLILEGIVIEKAKRKVKSINNLKIIAVTGSYGKTSTTSFIYTLLNGDKKVFTPKGNVNTSSVNTIMGISLSINSGMPLNTEILLLEVGAYKKGDIKRVCKMFPPDISVITSIGTEHLERFKSRENIIEAESENIIFAKKNSIVILPEDVYNIKTIPKIDSKEYRVTKFKETNFSNLKTYFRKDKKIYHTSLLGKAMLSNLTIAIDIAKLLDISNIQGKLQMIKPVERRLYPYYKKDILFIDDTYNIGIESAEQALNVLMFLKSKKVGSRTAILTGGIVELGMETESANKSYGELLNKINVIFLFNTPYTKYIENGINNKKKIIYIKDYKEFDYMKESILKKGDIVLMQNEITDLYYI